MKHIPEIQVGQRYTVNGNVWEVVNIDGPDKCWPIILREITRSRETVECWSRYWDNNMRYGDKSKDEFLSERYEMDVEARWFLRFDVFPA